MAMTTCPECGKELSDKAYSCPHCGYPVRQPSQPAKTLYKFRRGDPISSSFAQLLRVLAVICWIGGLIISIIGANVTVIGRYSNETQFSFGTFLTLLAPYVMYGVILMGMATVVDQVNGIYSMVHGMSLTTTEEGQSVKTSNSKPTYISHPKKSFGDWTCSKCGTRNGAANQYCKDCGTYR